MTPARSPPLPRPPPGGREEAGHLCSHWRIQQAVDPGWPHCNTGVDPPGWLRVLHDEIDGFGQSMATASRSGSPDVDVHLAAIAEAARRTAEVSGVVLAMLDYAVLDIGGTIRRWNTELPVLRQAIERLSLMLDEWPSPMKLARDALRGPSDEMPTQLRMVRSMLPRMPISSHPAGIMRWTAAPGSPSVSDLLGARLSRIWSMLRASRAAEPRRQGAR